MDQQDEDVINRKKRAERGWIADPPPPPPRDHIPGEEHKWYKMMGAAHLLPAEEIRPPAVDG